MTNTPVPRELDDVLWEFEQACPGPTASEIIEWCLRFPQYAADIRDYAAASRDCTASQEDCDVAVDQAVLDRGFSHVLNALHNAGNPTRANAGASVSGTFQIALKACKVDVKQLAVQMNITRGLLSDLFNGRMRPPVGRQFASAIMQHLAISRETFDAYLQRALDSPLSLGQARSTEVPSASAREYAELVRESSMPEDRKRYWLDED